MGKRVLLGMSGGIDSSVSAIILKEQGYEVIGATMQLCRNDNNDAFSGLEDAQNVCKQLGIEHHIINCEGLFKEKVINNFINAYLNGKTPNPCVECNKYLKFGEFVKKAEELKCDFIATGHYVKVEFSEKYNQYVLRKSNVEEKDQSYFLYGIEKSVLPKILIPLKEICNKAEVRQIAKEYNLRVANKPESQEVCFVPDNDYGKFLEQNLEKLPSKGNIVLNDGTIIGEHKGLVYYTIGQRKGLGISYKEPLYVVKIDTEKNELVVGEEKELYSYELVAEELNFLVDIDLTKPLGIYGKIRYRANPAKAILKVDNGVAKVIFEEAQRAITKGQSVVFYNEDIVIGGGKII